MGSAATHVVQVGFHLDPLGRRPAQLLEAWPTLVDVAEAARHAGMEVSVVQACHYADSIDRGGVSYHFFTHERAALALIRSLEPRLIHVHGLGFPRQVLRLADGLPGVPILLQDHASGPPRLWQRRLHRRAFAAAAAVAFCAAPQSFPFEAAGLIGPGASIRIIPESTSRFTPGSREAARAHTGLEGDPCLLWVGHLSANKDPLTVLEGVS